MSQNSMELYFSGLPEAELFTREVNESLAGVLAKNCTWSTEPGFVSASIDGLFWNDTLWTRDAGTFLREMAHWGLVDQGLLTTRYLFNQVRVNSQGYCMFPMYFRPGQPASGNELDGTSAILIGTVLLCERLAPSDPTRIELWNKLAEPASPVAGLLNVLEHTDLVAGSGEFGGGCGIEGEFYNVVQNNLVRLALLAVGRLAQTQGETDLTERCHTVANRLLQAMLEKLVYPDGSWIWCRNAPGMELDPAVLEHEINAGFGGINGILAMSSDVLGLLPAERNEPWLLPSVQTFLHLACTPDRLRQFSTHGIWTQFDRYWGGFLASPSYGHGYAVHCMQLMDWPELYTPAIHWLANATFQLLPGQILHRDSPYWFYERYYSPDAVGKVPLEEGCGALNLVCVTEPLKIARLILGLDDSNPNNLRLIPRLPLGWTRVQARQAPVLTPAGMKRVDIEVNANQRGEVTDVKIQPEGAVPGLKVRFGTARNPL